MRSTQQLSITLPHEMAEKVRAKVQSGEYASESEVIRDGLRALEMQKHALEVWLRNEAVPALIAMEAAPSTGLTSAQIRASLAAAYESVRKVG